MISTLTIPTFKYVTRLAAIVVVASGTSLAVAQEAAPAAAAKPDAAPAEGAKATESAKPDAAKKPSKAELGEMLKKCSEEADAKGLTVQKGKAEARKAYRRSCMTKNGVAPKKK